jgi:hypothetical protein
MKRKRNSTVSGLVKLININEETKTFAGFNLLKMI